MRAWMMQQGKLSLMPTPEAPTIIVPTDMAAASTIAMWAFPVD